MTLTKGNKTLAVLGLLCLTWVLGMVVFRGFVYDTLPIADGEPFGVADVLLYGLWCIQIAITGLVMVIAFLMLIFGHTQTKQGAIAMLVCQPLLFFVTPHLLTFAARF
uniref:hypothetical protein n=1 Tax=Thaumasiovibrio occultus TaxID=1891184 RepID=UPI000B3591E0|nr:hypothetical protein [Thaumasiovibrio occultus]